MSLHIFKKFKIFLIKIKLKKIMHKGTSTNHDKLFKCVVGKFFRQTAQILL